MGSDDWLEDLLLGGPEQGEYWTVGSRIEGSAVVLILSRDDQMFKLPWETLAERMAGWQVEVVHTGKRGFLPNRLLGRKANEMEVLAWASK